MEVDFMVCAGRRHAAVEVASGRSKGVLPGMEAFRNAFHPQRTLLVGGRGMSLSEFFLAPASAWLEP